MGSDTEHISLAHGSGGRLMQRLIKDVFLRYLDSPELSQLDDAAELSAESNRLAFSTDSFVVKPVFFPGGDIGGLAVSGTVNDLLMQGARPWVLSLGFILEEGFSQQDLARILESIKQTSEEAGIRVVTGDTKVVARGEADGIFISSAGLGYIISGVNVAGGNARDGDAVIVSGGIGEHGVAVMAERHGLKLRGDISSDAAPLTKIVVPMLERFGEALHVLRDPTRGGIAAVLNEIAAASGVGIVIDEPAVPVRGHVEAVCELLGLEPFSLACEGRFVAVVDKSAAPEIVEFLRSEADCPEAALIGATGDCPPGEVHLRTSSGGRRILDVPAGELLPRIC